MTSDLPGTNTDPSASRLNKGASTLDPGEVAFQHRQRERDARDVAKLVKKYTKKPDSPAEHVIGSTLVKYRSGSHADLLRKAFKKHEPAGTPRRLKSSSRGTYVRCFHPSSQLMIGRTSQRRPQRHHNLSPIMIKDSTAMKRWAIMYGRRGVNKRQEGGIGRLKGDIRGRREKGRVRGGKRERDIEGCLEREDRWRRRGKKEEVRKAKSWMKREK